MYNQQGFQNNVQNQAGAHYGSQYRGYETKYQPVGYVQSQYNQSLNQGTNNQWNSSFGSNQTAGSYHTANYRGNQAGHDAYLRSDSSQPSQSQYSGFAGQSSQFGSQYNAGISQQFGVSNQQQYGQYQNPQSYHTANYRGNQAGHDAYLRLDSSQPSQSQYSGFAGQSSQFGSQYNAGISQQFGVSNQQQQYGQYQNPQSYHTANYRGDQQGHDAYLRSDSTQPSQSQFGVNVSSINRYQV
ncbi:hypothetical protein [Paenibacillus naphthalenovorans]|uniref:hypothetical protein n=1 Tax=Paenibacillus naphthalenovorans TaxID=162209 RepID=UPI003D27DB00